ncbi:histidine kinase [Streptomyces sp. NBC_01016]|uniref:sensor histidine kinase n=1 Tax=Streptomyces sp. NBC_01016 TaxID=2903720 RepID=UPI00225C36A7|nr:histidine kinase [Streptomyces sp. NBC_01016]MCX4831870.1 histidine kinase [Streptomyces sp. NBC_01016]
MLHTRIPSTRSVTGNVALWSVLAAATGYGFLDAGTASPVLDLFLPLAVLAVAVPWSRHRPGAAVVLVNGLCVLGLADSATPGNAHVLSLAALSCALGARVAAAGRPLLVLAGCAAVDLATCAVLRVQPVWWFYTLTVLPAALLLPWLAGRHWRGRRELVREGWWLARSLEERQHLVAQQARLTERADIAADMHDSLGHALSLVAVRAGALELSPDLTDRDRADLAELRGTIADAVEQLRETVAVLHDPPVTDMGTGLPVNDSVEDLLGRAAASGVPVRWERRGAVPSMSPLVERGMYRVVQEALTNAVKHAPDCAIRVRITHEAVRTRVSVVNAVASAGGPAHAGEGQANIGGRGLTGLRERVTVLGGSLRTGPGAGGFQVTAVLPHQATVRPGTPVPVPGTAPGTPVGTRRSALSSGAAPHPDTTPDSDPYPDTDTPPDTFVPESTKRLASVRRDARRRSAAALVAPVVAAAFFVPSAFFLAWQLTTSVLPPSRFDELAIGRPRAELAPLLPDRSYPYPSDHVRSMSRPPGTRCEFYRSSRDLLAQVDLYRLCWSGNSLLTKDTVSASHPSLSEGHEVRRTPVPGPRNVSDPAGLLGFVPHPVSR